ncbi:PACE efflux transporter [Wohlfahrtiimonas larvae]|uniref:PACE efflux transporter n=1 Tax=Wohlfahrtiimonas larvae TaxID=1157986 RepID=UPI00098D2D6D|nr:PACE efflux transporter [Wohlfahrtiimonas larvae]
MALSNHRSVKERIFHAFTFEFFAIIFTMLIGVFILNKPISSMGILSVLISVTALLLNIVFNWLFDRIFPFVNGDRPVKIRMLHAIGFESTLVIFTVPMIAFFLKVSLVEAFMIEIGFLIFFLFYTYIYNWCYDKVRKKIVRS